MNRQWDIAYMLSHLFANDCPNSERTDRNKERQTNFKIIP